MPYRQCRNRRGRNRKGVALVLFAMLLMAVMALAALAIDLGYVQLTRRQMQGAVNTAALEALRNGPQPASELVAEQIFFDLSGQQIPFGAGPYIPYSGGIPLGGNLSGSQSLPLPTPGSGAQQNGSSVSGPWLPPQLAYSSTSQPGGDIVAGQYLGDSASHGEDGSYNRGDFTPQTGSPSATPPNAMLVRMRRSTEYSNGGLPAGATGGSPVPFLFGRGNPLLAYGGNMLLEDGVTVRATNIARWTPAVSIRVWNSGSAASSSSLYSVSYADPNFTGPLAQVPAPGQLPYAISPQSTASQSVALTDLFWTAPTDQDANAPANPTWTTTSTLVGNGIYATSQSATVTILTAGVYQDPLTSNQAVLVISPPTALSLFATLPSFSIVVGQAVAQIGSQPTQTLTGLIPIVSTGQNPGLIVGFAYVGFAPNSNTGTVTRYLTTTTGVQNYPLAQDPTPAAPVYVTHAVQNASASFGAVAFASGEVLPVSANLNGALQDRAATLLATDPTSGNPLVSAAYLLSAPALVRTMAAPIPQY